MTTNTSVEIKATNSSVYYWWIAGEGAGAAAGRQGTETNLSRAILQVAGLIGRYAEDEIAFVSYRRDFYDRPYPECERHIDSSAFATVAGMLNNPSKLAKHLIENAK